MQDQNRFVSVVQRAQRESSEFLFDFLLKRKWVARNGAIVLLSAASVVSAAPVARQPHPQPQLASWLASFAPSAPQATIAAGPRELRLAWSASSRVHHYRVYEKRGPNASFKQVGRALPRSASHKTIALSAHLQLEQASYVVAACNLAGCTRSAAVSAAEQAANAVEVIASPYEPHEPSGSARNQTFGVQLALSGDGATLAVADIWYYGGSEYPWYGSGAVYVYALTADGWVQEAKLEPTNPRGYDFFGSDLELSEDGGTLAIGSHYEGYDAPSQDAGPGTVFVFARANGVWSLEATLQAANPQDGASFGRSVELSGTGNTLAVGAPLEHAESEGAALPEAGAVYVFRRREGAWSAHADVRAPNPQSYDRFGLGVRLSRDGRTLGVLAGEQNAMTEDFETGTWPDRNNTVYLFGRASGDWSLEAEIEGSPDEPMLGGYSYDSEGQVEAFDLSADGRTLAIASPFATAPDGGIGLVRFYDRARGYWSPSDVALTPSIADRQVFGLRLTLSANGKTVAATASREDGVYGEPFVVVFARQNGTWSETAALRSPLYPDYTTFGNALSLSSSGARLAVGSSSYNTADTHWGAALVY